MVLRDRPNLTGYLGRVWEKLAWKNVFAPLFSWKKSSPFNHIREKNSSPFFLPKLPLLAIQTGTIDTEKKWAIKLRVRKDFFYYKILKINISYFKKSMGQVTGLIHSSMIQTINTYSELCWPMPGAFACTWVWHVYLPVRKRRVFYVDYKAFHALIRHPIYLFLNIIKFDIIIIINFAGLSGLYELLVL